MHEDPKVADVWRVGPTRPVGEEEGSSLARVQRGSGYAETFV